MASSRSLGGFSSPISGLCPRCTTLEAEAQRDEGAHLSPHSSTGAGFRWGMQTLSVPGNHSHDHISVLDQGQGAALCVLVCRVRRTAVLTSAGGCEEGVIEGSSRAPAADGRQAS